ncbi:glycosyltransferase family 2 protein [Paenibacillus jiagnxiensis]|uniref:glycosyltransferase family 2 protein n=1 Tax=Paenibacillus jiagnxiensis TaxID=3228926 RepID=UPI0033B2AF6F
MDQPSISLCMIVRNERKYLPKCLSSVQHIVDEIIIVDTGSTDDTVAIAKAFGAKVIEMPWQDSFADARNRSFDEATGDWILWLDADEEMDENEAEKLKELLSRDAVREQRIEGIQFVFCNHLEGGGVEYNYLHRLVRNRPEYRFEGRIHEQILPNMLKFDPGLQLGQVDIHVHHYGYLAQNVIDQDKIRRNITLLQQSMAEYPEYSHYYYYLSVELYRINDLEEALRHINVFLNRAEADTGKALLASAHKYRLIMLADLMRYDDLIRCSEESISKFPGFTDLYHLSAAGYQSLGKTGKAMELLRKALSMGPSEEGYPSVAGHGTFLTCRDLGQLCASVGNSKDADLYFTLASVMTGDARIIFQEPRVS